MTEKKYRVSKLLSQDISAGCDIFGVSIYRSKWTIQKMTEKKYRVSRLVTISVQFLVSQFTGHFPKKATNIQNKCDQMSKNHVSKFTCTEKIEKREERVLIFHPRGLE